MTKPYTQYTDEKNELPLFSELEETKSSNLFKTPQYDFTNTNKVIIIAILYVLSQMFCYYTASIAMEILK